MSSVGPLSGPVSQSAKHAATTHVPPADAPPTHVSPDEISPADRAADSSSLLGSRTRQPIIPWVTDGLIKHRKLALVAALIPLLISFNGRWRIGLDSSIYRGLARSLAQGQGYHFGEFGSRQIYPGLPVLLAGMTKIFGEHVFRPIAPLALMLIMSLATLLIIHRLIARHYPQWMAICVTAGVAVNSWFVRLSHDVLTDIPFLLGAMAALLGWDLLQAASQPRQRFKSASLMISGLALAAVMRPTFWILCLAFLCYWAFGLIRGLVKGGWKLYACCLGILFLLCLGFWAIDPRTGPFHPFSGGYEAEMLETLQDSKTSPTDGDTSQPLRARIMQETGRLLSSHLPASFLGQELPWMGNVVVSVLLIGSSILIARKQPVWAMFVLFTIGVTVMLSTAPRYYVMILPFLLLGALLMLHKLDEWIGGGWGDAAFGIGLLVIIVINLSKVAPFVFEQQRVPFYESGMRFYETYRHRKFAPMIRLADVVRANVPPGARVITPSAQIVRYLSDREVLMERELVSARKGVRHYPERLAGMNIAYAAFPARIYSDKEPVLAQLIKHGVIRPGRRIAMVDDIRLSEARIVVPSGDWTKATRAAAAPTTRKVKSATKPTTRSAAAKRKAITKKKETKAAKDRRLKKQAVLRRAKIAKKLKKRAATTSPATRADTQ